MVKVFRFNSPLSVLFLFALLALFFLVGLPLVLVTAAGFIILSSIRALLSPSQSRPLQEHNENSKISPVIHNDKIGSYRVIEDLNDPNVIEVEKL